jgi:hypothetical protein
MPPVDEPRNSFAHLILDPAVGCAAAYLGGSTKPDQEGLIVSNVDHAGRLFADSAVSTGGTKTAFESIRSGYQELSKTVHRTAER